MKISPRGKGGKKDRAETVEKKKRGKRVKELWQKTTFCRLSGGRREKKKKD